MSHPTQSYANHGKMVPLFHYVATPLLLAVFVWRVRDVAVAPSVDAVMDLLLTVVVGIVFWYARTFALGVQDRVIRLEERLRMDRLFDDGMRARIGEFTTSQLIALRFASDGELPALARRVLDEGLRDRKAIKMAVREWRADHQRI